MSRDVTTLPVVDLFAGPGGLGEGFSSLIDAGGIPLFKIALSIEKDAAAHQTLELRSFFRQFLLEGGAPEDYYRHLRGELSREDLFCSYTFQAAQARLEAWHAELGKIRPAVVDRRIKEALSGASFWVLCGGPPCQAYSIIGRSRNGGIDHEDHRLYLYREYLRILAEHRPPVFIFENVKGLLSSRVGGNGIFHQLLADLRHPGGAVRAGTRSCGYFIYSLVVAPQTQTLDREPDFAYRDFIIKCEDYGIPQSRHRVILLGIREDFATSRVPTLVPYSSQVPASHVLRGLPRLRSGLSRTQDGKEEWRSAVGAILAGRVLDGIPNGKGRDLVRDISWTVSRIRDSRADRGAPFLACTPTIQYRPDWYCDPRVGGICNHESRPHIAEDLHRYLFASCYAKLFGRSPELRDFPPALLPKHRNVNDKNKQEFFDDRFRVQVNDRPATTITSHMAKDGHYYIHYDETQCRSLTVREAARLQTFPDNYFFCGTRTQQYVQVGNAVPPLLAHQIARIVAEIFRSRGNRLSEENDTHPRRSSAVSVRWGVGR